LSILLIGYWKNNGKQERNIYLVGIRSAFNLLGVLFLMRRLDQSGMVGRILLIESLASSDEIEVLDCSKRAICKI